MATLCEYCKDFSIASVLETDYRHQPSFEGLKKSAGSGCNLCQLFSKSLLETVRFDDLTGEPNGEIWIRKDSREDPYIIGPRPIIIVECRGENLYPNALGGKYPQTRGHLHLVADEGKHIVLLSGIQ
jgi:hypothetical protein